MRVRTKICGITRIEDARAAVGAGADALGFVFHRPSARYLSPSAAQSIIRELPPFVTPVGLFVDASAQEIEAAIDVAKVTVLQFHGEETAADCEAFGRPYIKAVRVAPGVDVDCFRASHPRACALLLDTYVEGQSGGTGRTFDWSLWPKHCAVPMILAGGLTVENVAQAIAATHPYAVDVSGGVETGRRGIKDPQRIREFIDEVTRGSSQGL